MILVIAMAMLPVVASVVMAAPIISIPFAAVSSARFNRHGRPAWISRGDMAGRRRFQQGEASLPAILAHRPACPSQPDGDNGVYYRSVHFPFSDCPESLCNWLDGKSP